jgi:hypothetical protein
MVLVHHVVDLPLVPRVGEIASKDRPQVIVLGGVVAPEALSKLAPPLDHLGAICPVLLYVDLGLDACHVASQGVVHREHEADIGTLVACSRAPAPGSEQCGDNDAEDSDQRDHPCDLAVVSYRHQYLLLCGAVVSQN